MTTLHLVDPTPLTERQQQTDRFLRYLDPDATFFAFTTLDDDKEREKAYKAAHDDRPDPKMTGTKYGTLLQHWDWLEERNQRGCGIFVTVQETAKGRRSIDDIKRIRAIPLDLDGEPLDPVLKWKYKPHLVINTSPGKYHCYWMVEYWPLDRQLFYDVCMHLSAPEMFHSDRSVNDIARIMRLPGFFHMKDPSRPFPVEINEEYCNFDLERYTDQEFRELLPSEPEPGGGETVQMQSGGTNYIRIILDHLDDWVPFVMGNKVRKTRDGWEATSRALGRDLEERLSFTKKGIKDFGEADMGDPREGKRTPVEIVMKYYMDGQSGFDEHDALCLLCDRVGIPRPPRLVAPLFSDDFMALQFSEKYADDLRFVSKLGRWLQWSGVQWVEDDTLKVFDMARVLCREIALRGNKPKRELASAKIVAAVEKLARSDRRHAITHEQLDVDTFTFNEMEDL